MIYVAAYLFSALTILLSMSFLFNVYNQLCASRSVEASFSVDKIIRKFIFALNF